jgi:hypothetical protein
MASIPRFVRATGRATGHLLVVALFPRSVRAAAGPALAAVLSPLVRWIVRVVVVVVIAGTVLTVRGHGNPLAGVTREGVLLLGALLILTLSGALAPQGRLLLRYIQKEGRRRDGTRLGWFFQTIAQGMESVRTQREKDKERKHEQ